MTDTHSEELRVRVARALHEVDKANALLRDGEFLTAAQLARRAAESLLTLVAITSGQLRQEDRKDDLHLEQLSHILRRGDALPKRIGDHIESVKRVGNRAAHPQASLSDEVTAQDAEAALRALDEVVHWFRRKVPAELLPPSGTPPAPPPTQAPKVAPTRAPAAPVRRPARPWLRNLGLVAAALTAPLVGFKGMLWALSLVGSTSPLSATVPVQPPPALEADPAEDAQGAAPTLDAAAAADRVDAVRMRLSADLDLTPDALAGLGCSDLAHARNWLWVRHGYVLRDATERAAFGSLSPTARPAATAREIRRDFTSHDQVNQSLLEQALRSGGCPCPPRVRPDRPCPE